MTALHRPRSLMEAAELLARLGGDSQVLAGGTATMLPERRLVVRPDLVALARVAELKGIHVRDDGSLRIGALTTHAQLAGSPVVRSFCPALASAFGRIASVQVRNQATIGGNLALADPAHDPPSILLALDARARIASASGEREAPIDLLASGPFASTLTGAEIISAIVVPRCEGLAVAHRKLVAHAGSFRQQAGYPIVSCGVALAIDGDGVIRAARVGISGAHDRPLRARAAERLLIGSPPIAATLGAVGDRIRQGLRPLSDDRGSADYKRDMAAVCVQRTIVDAAAARVPTSCADG